MNLRWTTPSLRVALLLGCVVITLFVIGPSRVGTDDAGGELSGVVEVLPAEPELVRSEVVLERNSTVEGVLLQLGFERQELHSLIRDVRPVYNLNRVKAGHSFAVERLSDGTFKGLEYHISDEQYLLVQSDSDGYSASLYNYNLETVVEEFYGEIEESLWTTMLSGGETDHLVFKLTQVLQWDVDFTAIQPQDSVKLIFEKKYLDGEFVKYGEILSVVFTSRERSFSAFLFENPDSGKRQYYDEKGLPVRKAFLKVPFSFDPRITSRFSHSRYHPILKKRRPHLGVDYGAPHGTPVLAAGSGRVVFAGRDGGFGKLVRIRHPNGYTTAYAHLSRIEVRRGQEVNQGQRVGRVGATGLATGPHLDYRVQDQRGRYINPRNVSALPSDKPLDQKYWDQFAAVRDHFTDQLTSIATVPPVDGMSLAD